MSPTSPQISGLDRAVADPALLRPGRVGLLTHFAAVTADLDRGVDALRRAGVEVTCLISPEHGYWGTGQAGDGNDEDRDAATGLPVLDAYGKDAAGLEDLLAAAGIDQVVVDLQDIGCRFYTYMWSMVDVMAACARLGLPITVLDRPSPLPALAAGPGLDPACASFVGRLGVPLRHGARLGAIARTVAADHLGAALDLDVVEAPGEDGTAPWVPPSPNMPSLDTVALYPGTGLLEGTTLCEGRGTTRPFEILGAPWCGPELAARLHASCRPAYIGVRQRGRVVRRTHGRPSRGRRIHGAVDSTCACPRMTRRGHHRRVRPLAIGHAVISTVAALHPDRPLWREQVPGRPPFIDLLWGSPAFREGIEDGAGLDEILAASPAPIPLHA